MTTLQEIFTEWANNPAFRTALKTNPEEALKNAGFEVSPEDMQKIKAMLKLKKSQDEELDDRINK